MGSTRTCAMFLAMAACASAQRDPEVTPASASALAPDTASTPAPAPVAPHRRSVSHAVNGMVAAEHPLAVLVGLETLHDGGSAVDAAVAMNMALGALQPNVNGMGGDLFAIGWDAKSGEIYGLNASGRSPGSLTIERVEPLPDGTIDPRSPDSWSVPGCVDGWTQLHGRFGRLPWKTLMAPAIRLADEGAPVPRVVASYWARAAEAFAKMPGFAETFMPGGRAPREGEVFRNPRLAESLRQISVGGRDAFYEGAIAKRIVAFSRRHGGHFTLDDFASHRSEWVTPISTSYRGVDVYELPPNGQGLAALQMLNILETFDLAKMGRDSPEFWHTMIEAKKLAFADRAQFYADPAFAKLPIAELLSKDYAAERARRIDPRHASTQVSHGDHRIEAGDTTFLAVADAEGNMISLIQSNYTGFGSGHVVAGFGLQNRGALFALDPEHANALQPKKRPFHTIIPAFAVRDGKPWLAFGVMGGAMQPQGHVQILVNLLDFGMDLQQAGDAPRFRHVGSAQPTGTPMREGGIVNLEQISETIVRELAAMGHRVEPGGYFGGYQAVARDPETGVFSGATESRKDGLAMGL